MKKCWEGIRKDARKRIRKGRCRSKWSCRYSHNGCSYFSIHIQVSANVSRQIGNVFGISKMFSRLAFQRVDLMEALKPRSIFTANTRLLGWVNQRAAMSQISIVKNGSENRFNRKLHLNAIKIKSDKERKLGFWGFNVASGNSAFVGVWQNHLGNVKVNVLPLKVPFVPIPARSPVTSNDIFISGRKKSYFQFSGRFLFYFHRTKTFFSFLEGYMFFSSIFERKNYIFSFL